MTRSTFKTFNYSDAFNQRVRSRLSEELLLIGDLIPPQLILLRVLSGTANVKHNYDDMEIKSRVNYFDPAFTGTPSDWATNIASMISQDISINDVKDYLIATRTINHGFYNAILAEVSQFLVHTKRKSHTAAFIYIYRLLEKISCAFPIIYSQQTSDYQRTFSNLKNMMLGDKDKSEVGFFKIFVNKLFEDSALKSTSVDLNINAATVEIQERIFKSMKNSCEERIIHEDTIEPRCLAINFCDFGSFIVSIRNKFFHYRNETGNIESERIVDSDLFFEHLNKYALQWICTVYITILTHNISQYQSRT